MSGLTNYLKERLLNHFLRSGSPYTSPSTIYLGLDTVLGTEAGGGTEVVGTNYVRAAVTFGAFASRGIVSNNTLTWLAGSNWGTVVGFRLWDASTGGNALAFGQIVPRPTILSGSAYQLAPGEVVITLPSTFPIGPFLAQRFLEKAFQAQTHASLSGSLHMHLVTTKPDNDGAGGVVLAASGYASQTAAFAAYASGRSFLSADITYSASAPVAWGTIPAAVLRDNSAYGSGNFLAVFDIAPVPTFGSGAPVVLQAASTFLGLIEGGA
jgi:hypothetical protein